MNHQCETQGIRIAGVIVLILLCVGTTTVNFAQDTVTKPSRQFGYGSIMCATFASDSAHLVISGGEYLQLVETNTASTIRRFSGHSLGNYSVAYSPDGNRLLAGFNNATVLIWD